MANNASISYDDILRRSTTTLSESTALTGAGVGNLATQRLHSLWRASGNSASIEIDAGSSVTARVIWMGAVNFTSSCTIRIRVSDSAMGSTDVLDTGEVAADVNSDLRTLIHFLSSDTSGRYWQVNIEDTTLTRLEAAAMHLGPIKRPAINIDFDYEIYWVDPSMERRSIGQQPFRIVRPKYREATVRWQWLSEAEAMADLLGTLELTAGRTTNVLLVFDEDGGYLHEQAIWGPLVDLGKFRRRRTGNAEYQKSYRIREVPPPYDRG